MTRAGLSRAMIACLGLGAADVAALNLAVLPELRERATARSTTVATRPPAAPAPVPAPAVTVMTMEPPSPPPAPQARPAPAPEPVAVVAPAPAPAPEPAPEPVVEPRATAAIVEFESNSHRVGLRATWTLNKLAVRLHGAPELLVVGHADASGSPEINERLSALRAESVARRLAELGVARARLRVDARGDREPRGTGNDRRVEIFIGGNP